MCNNDRKNKELPYNSRRVPIEIIMREREKKFEFGDRMYSF